MQKLRVHYAKRGRLRFTSHRDFQRAFERALRRAQVPIAFSQGFTPHPKVSYAGASPTGAASEAEYLEISTTARCDPERLRLALDRALPEGLDLVEVVEAGPGGLPERLEASVWRIVLPGVRDDALADAVRVFLAESTVEVERLTKNGTRMLDARAAVLRLAVGDVGAGQAYDGPCAILELVVRNGSPTVRPDDVLAGLRRLADLEPLAPFQATRLAQGPIDTGSGTVGDPLVPDRDAAHGERADAAVPEQPTDA